MQKIPTLFARDWEGDRRYVLPEVVPGCEWVIAGEGIATRKYDGTCTMFDGTHWWARREVRKGRAVPAGFITTGTDPQTGKVMGWELIEQSSFAQWHAEALVSEEGDEAWRPGTYELCGPKVNGNPEGYRCHWLISHAGAVELRTAPRDFEGLRAWCHTRSYEGIVWHHPDGRMAKIKKRDFRAPQPGTTGA